MTFYRTLNTSLPRRWRDWLTLCAATASDNGKSVTSGGRTAPAAMQRDDALEVRPVAGHVRPQGLHVAARRLGRLCARGDEGCASAGLQHGERAAASRSPPTVSNTASHPETTLVKSCAL